MISIYPPIYRIKRLTINRNGFNMNLIQRLTLIPLSGLDEIIHSIYSIITDNRDNLLIYIGERLDQFANTDYFVRKLKEELDTVQLKFDQPEQVGSTRPGRIR